MGSNPSKIIQIPRSTSKSARTNQNASKTGEDAGGRLVMIAIDFGTVRSGFAYSFKGDEDNITTATHGGMLEEDREPTILLLNPDKTMHSFGIKALRNYCDLEKNEREKYFFMENFKMELYNKKTISRHMTIKDKTGKPVKAMKVFSKAIKYLKTISLKIVFQTKLDLEESDIQWMITIPAISSDSARQFMREAAMKAGIPEDQLRLVLEPEAAALYCQKETLVYVKGKSLPVGFQYTLADLGGGTSDFCAHEVLKDGNLREVYRAIGEIAGGTGVDKKFVSFMKELVGKEVWAEFKSNHPSSYRDFINSFHREKRVFSSSCRKTELKMENALLDVLNKKTGHSLQEQIKESKYADEMEYFPTEARLHIHSDLIKLFFKTSIENIVKLLDEILEACPADNNTLLLVGGYSESPYLRELIQSEFSNMRLVLVVDARLAVLKGAVMMGWQPKTVIQRRSRFTYGFAINKLFIEGKHPESLKYIKDGQVRCKWVFEKMIEKNQIVQFGEIFRLKGYESARKIEEKYKKKCTILYRSTKKNPKYCREEEECVRVGYIEKQPPPEGWFNYWEIETHLIVGETEFTVKYFNLKTGRVYKAQMDFL